MTNPRAVCLLLCLVAAGCSGKGLEHDLGLARDTPDEFAVTTRAPLAIPNDVSLPTPQPGAPRPQEPAAQVAAASALTPSIALNNRTGHDTPGQEALLAAAGPPAPADIRENLDANAKRLNSNGGVANSLKFWQKTPPPGKVIDPVKEAQRLRDQAAARP